MYAMWFFQCALPWMSMRNIYLYIYNIVVMLSNGFHNLSNIKYILRIKHCFEILIPRAEEALLKARHLEEQAKNGITLAANKCPDETKSELEILTATECKLVTFNYLC